MNNKITSLDQLKEWNDQYLVGCTFIKEKDESKFPILLDWFLDWFFAEALNDINVAKEAFVEYINISFICSNDSFDECFSKCLRNLNYWYYRASYVNKRRKRKQFEKFKAKCL